MYRALRRALFLVAPERIHTWVFALLRAVTAILPLRRMLARSLAPHDPVLASTVFGVSFAGPLGLAAGFDKDGRGMNTWGALGFGYAEVGTVTAQAQPGNPPPRMFRLPEDRALLNRMGFNNHGAAELALRLARRTPEVPIGVNIGKTKVTPHDGAVDDYAESARLVGPLAAFLVVNVSSPNTPGLRDLQAAESLRPILAAVNGQTSTPVLVKIAPDLSDDDVDEIADLTVELGLAGIVATNTTVSRDGLATPGVESLGAGGVSGPPVALSGGVAPAVPPGWRPGGADQCRRHRDRRRRVGPHHVGRVAAAGLHRVHLRRRAVGQAHSRRPGPQAARGRLYIAGRRGWLGRALIKSLLSVLSVRGCRE
jgi:dihydroorotate dehydrogenase